MTNRSEDTTYIRWFETLGSVDVALVGGRNASLGEIGVAGCGSPCTVLCRDRALFP